MDIFRNNLNAARTGLSLVFQNAFAGVTDTLYQEFCMVEGDPTHTAFELPFLEAFTFMRKWQGDRQVKNLASRKLRVVEDAFEDTVGIPQRDLETDNWGQYRLAVSQMGVNAPRLWDRLSVEALTKAPTWIDNKAFFKTDRKYGDAVINNVTTDALTGDSLNTGYDTMLAYCGHNSETLGVMPTLLMVGPKLRKTAKRLLEAETIAVNGVPEDNPTKGLVRYIVNPRLVGTYADDWYLMDARGPIKPVLLLRNKDARLVSLNQPTDQNVFMEGKAIFGCDAYGNAAAAFPHLVYRGGR